VNRAGHNVYDHTAGGSHGVEELARLVLLPHELCRGTTLSSAPLPAILSGVLREND
jgi:hypothetical protein